MFPFIALRIHTDAWLLSILFVHIFRRTIPLSWLIIPFIFKLSILSHSPFSSFWRVMRLRTRINDRWLTVIHPDSLFLKEDRSLSPPLSTVHSLPVSFSLHCGCVLSALPAHFHNAFSFHSHPCSWGSFHFHLCCTQFKSEPDQLQQKPPISHQLELL